MARVVPLPYLAFVIAAIVVSLSGAQLEAMETTTRLDEDDGSDIIAWTAFSIHVGPDQEKPVTPSPGLQSRGCWTLMHEDEFSLLVSPPSRTSDLTQAVYNTDQNVTLTCELKIQPQQQQQRLPQPPPPPPPPQQQQQRQRQRQRPQRLPPRQQRLPPSQQQQQRRRQPSLLQLLRFQSDSSAASSTAAVANPPAPQPTLQATPLPFVMISSCAKCLDGRRIHSEPARGKTQLRLTSQTFLSDVAGLGQSPCGGDIDYHQFSCWRYHADSVPVAGTCVAQRLSPSVTVAIDAVAVAEAKTIADDLVQPDHDCFAATLQGTGLFRTVQFQELPRPVSIQCVSRNWVELTCTWTLTTGSFWPLNGHSQGLVSFSYPCSPWDTDGDCMAGVRSYQNVARPLRKSLDNDTITLDLTLTQGNFTPDTRYSLAFVIKTDVGDVIGNNSVITDRSIVQYKAVRGLSVTGDVNNSTLLLVRWSLPSSVPYSNDFVCRLRLVAASAHWMTRETAMNRTITVPAAQGEGEVKGACGGGDAGDHVTVTGLHAYVTYQFHVQFRHWQSSFWSDVAVASGTTTQDVPSRAPEVIPGGFQRTSCDTGDCLTVYIKAPSPEFHNGVLTGYQLEVFQDPDLGPSSQTDPAGARNRGSGPAPATIVSRFPPDSLTLTARLVSAAHGRACVRAGTSIGFSRARACLEVPGVSRSSLDPKVPAAPHQVTVDYVADNSSYVVQWTSAAAATGNPVDGDPAQYTVFWCRGHANKTSVTCTSDIHWEHVHSNSTTSFLAVSGAALTPTTSAARSSPESSWLFGVSNVRGKLSGGMVSSQCCFDDDQGLVVPPDFQFWQIMERQITVTWNVNCYVPFLYARPLHFDVYYTEVTTYLNQSKCTEGHKITVTPNASDRVFSHVISDLKTGATYNVCMRTFSTRGGSDVSSPHPVTLRQKKASQDNVRAVVPAVLLSAFALAGLWAFWLCRKSVKERTEKFAPSLGLTEQQPMCSLSTSSSDPSEYDSPKWMERGCDNEAFSLDIIHPDPHHQHHHPDSPAGTADRASSDERSSDNAPSGPQKSPGQEVGDLGPPVMVTGMEHQETETALGERSGVGARIPEISSSTGQGPHHPLTPSPSAERDEDEEQGGTNRDGVSVQENVTGDVRRSSSSGNTGMLVASGGKFRMSSENLFSSDVHRNSGPSGSYTGRKLWEHFGDSDDFPAVSPQRRQSTPASMADNSPEASGNSRHSAPDSMADNSPEASGNSRHSAPGSMADNSPEASGNSRHSAPDSVADNSPEASGNSGHSAPASKADTSTTVTPYMQLSYVPQALPIGPVDDFEFEEEELSDCSLDPMGEFFIIDTDLTVLNDRVEY